ncbi:zinc finger protein, putative [Entamoeba histolytica HM-1:IMSS-B]|uniref:Zinc finger protein, putative n=6 Tax=Entamoeba histolytica TaxID=5759 RepID=C4LWT0_ENTH1|nr:zinc finger protein, putative [Entamoeba histolytica HM-1:IMSS]EMD42420.1 nhl repeatcontaining protein [Entamoeba histolytica KU27]EMH75681.1 zinc finger protein, putative [Entamoeba histolytica HM-1:IMSS-B]EMS11974.1 nhl repeat-containing protein [Entamoeba histolytica HM-3:IMSS]ENY65675.1 nhl repeat-containing protein [Entamoeba histolytica HM-1:IMSS-A]GAT93173.1 zinc finger protein putative [Entamoeba histolytica]|eukprot:XP_654989.2 zinc finger protein, putative [Entamoeba histolytica HM-1:IMSS]
MCSRSRIDVCRCGFCDGHFSIPNIPKVLPCTHVICRDCIMSLIQSQKSHNEYSEEESELYCPQCHKFIQLPFGSPEILPTPYKRIKKVFEFAQCTDEKGCENKALGYCFNCQVNFCIDHSSLHVKRKHSIEVFKPGKFCLVHMKSAEMYCYTCQCVICSVCQRDIHRKHNITQLSLFYAHYMKGPTLPKLYQNLRKLSNCLTKINSLSSVDDSNEINSSLESINYSLKINAHSSFSQKIENTAIMILPINTTKTILLKELCINSLHHLQIQIYPTKPIPHPPSTGHLKYSLTTLQIEESPTEGGILTVSVNEDEIVLHGEQEGDVLIKISCKGIEIDNSPIRVRIAPPLQVISSNATSDKNKVYITYLCSINGGYAVVDSGNDCVKIIGNEFMIFGGRGNGRGQFKNPVGIAVGVIGKEEWVWVVDKGNNRVQLFIKGRYVRSYQKEGKSSLKAPSSCVYVQKEQLLYVTDTENDRIAIFAHDGTFIKAIGVDFNQPTDIKAITIGNQVMFVIADTGNNRIVITNNQGYIIQVKGSIGEERRGRFDHPNLLAVDHRRQEIYVSEGKVRIQKFDFSFNYKQTFDVQVGEVTSMHYDSLSDVLVVCGKSCDDIHLFTQDLLEYYVI